ncbi:MAG: hypothetical protein QNK11_04040, partial [Legionella sp.]|nr:hypothetical protein [Legionella sp.]
MHKYGIFNTVWNDGLGDFTHFVEILQALKSNPYFQGVEFLPIIYFDERGKPANKKIVSDTLVKMGYADALFGIQADHEVFSSNVQIQEQIKALDQVIVISCDLGDLLVLYGAYLKKEIPIKLIAEHEAEIFFPKFIIQDAFITEASLGLSHHASGIKVKPLDPMQPKKAWGIIENAHPNFSKKLLESTDSDSFDSFFKQNIIVPAYFNKDADFRIFLNRLAIAQSEFKDKDIVIYHSGSTLSEYEDLGNLQKIQLMLNATSIKEIQMIKPEEDTSLMLQCNPEGTQTIRIFNGFYLNNLSFDA